MRHNDNLVIPYKLLAVTSYTRCCINRYAIICINLALQCMQRWSLLKIVIFVHTETRVEKFWESIALGAGLCSSTASSQSMKSDPFELLDIGHIHPLVKVLKFDILKFWFQNFHVRNFKTWSIQLVLCWVDGRDELSKGSLVNCDHMGTILSTVLCTQYTWLYSTAQQLKHFPHKVQQYCSALYCTAWYFTVGRNPLFTSPLLLQEFFRAPQ